MSDSLHLRNPPIVEAVIDIDCDLRPDLDFLSLETMAKEKYGDSYPKVRRRFAEVLEVKTTADESSSESSVKRRLDAFQLLQQGDKQLLQIRRNGYSLNRLAPYPGLDALLPEVRRTWGIFCELTSPTQVRRVQLRYINRILFPMPDSSLDLRRVLECGPLMADEDGLALAGFLTQYSAVETATGLTVHAVLARERVEGPHLVLIFDNSAFDDRPFEAGKWSELENRISELRRLKNRIFANTLTAECLDQYR